jgi:hypothetical protein
MRAVILAFAHPLLICFVFRIILFVVLEKWSSHSPYRASADANTQRYSQNPNATFQIHSHIGVPFLLEEARPWPFRRVRRADCTG